jgi:hypothetical protein
MLQVGAVEPDEMPCPESAREMATQVEEDLRGTRKYDMSICRIGIQIYHASPFPLIKGSKQLKSVPNKNGYTASDNYEKDLFAVGNYRQWRTAMIWLMSRESMYAFASPDVLEAARRLGNVFHTLSDSFSASQVTRSGVHAMPAGTSSADIEEICKSLTVTTAISMDVVNWIHHVLTDSVKDVLYKCSAMWEKKAIGIWSEVRSRPVKTAADVNGGIDRMIKEVFCPALSMTGSLDYPAGGADEYYSSDSIQSFKHFDYKHPFDEHPVMPVGDVASTDADRILDHWTERLADYRASQASNADNQARVPIGLIRPPRAVDVCGTPEYAHVSDDDVQKVLSGDVPPNYLMDATEMPVRA